ncbi:TetR/AcrR family transcriptional regulator [Cytophagaceae bacterium ABcell3]|nr:TetR/AcrR family transcriptional regulator [Cytophagaceae bacterium ABcell3]
MDINKQRIIDGASELFFKYGIKSVTMDEIASHLAVSKKTIYQSFKDKSALVIAVTDKFLQENRVKCEKYAEEALDPVDEILKISNNIKEMFRSMNPMVLFEVEKYFPQAFKLFLEHKESCIRESIANNLRKGIEAGLYRADVDVDIISILRIEQVEMAFNPTVFSPDVFDFTKVQLQFIDHYLYGICTLKGHKLINKYKKISEEE